MGLDAYREATEYKRFLKWKLAASKFGEGKSRKGRGKCSKTAQFFEKRFGSV
jgi:hypothetical protein